MFQCSWCLILAHVIVHKQNSIWTREKLGGSLTWPYSWCTDQILHPHLDGERWVPSLECCPLSLHPCLPEIPPSQRELKDRGGNAKAWFLCFHPGQTWRTIPASGTSHGRPLLWLKSKSTSPIAKPCFSYPLTSAMSKNTAKRNTSSQIPVSQEHDSWHQGNEIYRVESWIV